jgi:hypothetical protein
MFLCLGLPVSFAATVTIFDNIPEPGQTNYNTSYFSHGFQAQGTTELGNLVNFAGTARKLDTIKVNMVTYAQSNSWTAWAATNSSANASGYYHELILRVYTLTSSNTVQLLTHQTNNVLVPWAQPTGTNSFTGLPNTGQAFTVSYNFSAANILLPDSAIISIGFNTQTYGDWPVGSAGPYDSLNFGMMYSSNTIVGSDANPNDVFRVKDGVPYYPETGTYWTGNAPMMEVTASSAAPYDIWIATYSNYNSSTVPGRRTDDPDGDGLSNLAEFAFGLDPTANSPNPITIARSNTTVTITWLQRNDNSATYTNRSTTNLTTGFPVGNSTNFPGSLSANTNNLPRPEYSRYQFSTNVSAFLRHFYKVDAAEAP